MRPSRGCAPSRFFEKGPSRTSASRDLFKRQIAGTVIRMFQVWRGHSCPRTPAVPPATIPKAPSSRRGHHEPEHQGIWSKRQIAGTVIRMVQVWRGHSCPRTPAAPTRNHPQSPVILSEVEPSAKRMARRSRRTPTPSRSLSRRNSDEEADPQAVILTLLRQHAVVRSSGKRNSRVTSGVSRLFRDPRIAGSP